jgi:hypothetical protein
VDNGNEDFRTKSTNDAPHMEGSHTGEHLEVQSSSTGFSFSVDAFRVEIENKQSGDYVVEAEQQQPIIDPASFQADLLARLGLGPTLSIETPISLLYAELKKPFWEKRAIAARTLGTINLSSGEERETCIVKLRVRALADPDFRVRIAAIEALGKIAHDEAYSILTLVLQQEQQPVDVRAAALRTLGTLRESIDTQPIITALQDEHGIIRSLAVQILGSRKQIEHIHYFFMALEDDDSSVRIEAMKAIASISGKKVLSRISFIAWKDRDPRVRFEAQAILDTFGVLSASQRLHMALQLSSPEPINESEYAFDWPDKDLNTSQNSIPSTINHVLQKMYDHSTIWFAPEPVASQHEQLEHVPHNVKNTHLSTTNSSSKEQILYIPQISFPDDASKEKQKHRRQHLHPAIRQVAVVAMLFLFLSMTIIGSIHHSLWASGAITTNNAQWAGPPTTTQMTIQQNQPFSIEVDFKNTGATQWSEQDGYQLVGTFLGNSSALLLQKQYFSIGAQVIHPGKTLIIKVEVVAPVSPGDYQLQWHIARYYKPFGGSSASAEIHIYSKQLGPLFQENRCVYECKTRLPNIARMPIFLSKPRKFQQEQLSSPLMGGGSFSLPDSPLKIIVW